MQTDDAAIAIRNLSFSVQTRKIIDMVSLVVQHKCIAGIIGPNGSGKTTLLKHLYRALPADKKTVFINGSAVEEYSCSEAAQMLTVMRQENTNDFDYSVMEMVLMGRTPHKRIFDPETETDRIIAMQALEYTGMADCAERSFVTLSGGEKQRVLIARSIAQQADIFVLDEPTNHLDVYYQWSLMETIKGLNKTVLAVFHELNLACTFCDYLFVMHQGKIVACGAPHEVCTEALLADIFRIQAEIVKDKYNRPHILYTHAIMDAAS